MQSRFLQWFGALVLIGLAGGGVAAWVAVGEGLHVTFAHESASGSAGERANAPPPWAAIGDDVASVRADLRAFANGMGPQLESLAEAITTAGEAAAAQRDAAVRQELAAARGEIAALAAAHGKANAEIAALRAELAARSAERSRTEPAPEVAVATPLTADPPVAPAVAPTVALTAAPRKKGFLRFELPSESFVFDRRQRFALLPALSRVGFDAKSTLHDFSGVTSKLEGELQVNLAAPADHPSGTIAVDAASLSTALDGRDEKMREHLAVTDHPEIRFSFTGFKDAVVDGATLSVHGTALGDLTIRGVTRAIELPVAVTQDESKRLVIEGSLPIRLSDYSVPVPSQLGLIKVEDEVNLWVALKARCLGPATEATK